jgi:hypothetical protein
VNNISTGVKNFPQSFWRIIFRIAPFLAFLLPGRGATLGAETAKAWEDYIRVAHIRVRDQVNSGQAFLWLDGSPDRVTQVRQGEVVVSMAPANIPREVPSGLIHDWIGAVFIPGATIGQVLSVLRNYGRYQDFYRPSVLASKPIALGDAEDRFRILLANRSFFRKSALETDYTSSQFRVDQRRLYTLTRTTRIQEIEEFGGAGQHMLPEDEGTGLIWRLFSVARFEERDGGVYVEIEAIALSRDIPASLRWLIEPIVRRVAKASLASSLQQTREAVLAACALENRSLALGTRQSGSHYTATLNSAR